MNIYFENLCKDYEGKVVFKDITGRINENDKIGVVGVNGVGKTTLVKLICGLEVYDSGNIRYSPNYLKVLYLSENFSDGEDVSVYEEILKHFNTNSNSNAEYEIKKTLKELGLDEKLWEQKVSSLSGGEKTKLMLCKAFLIEYDVLILDEPTNHLDIESIAKLEGFIKGLNKTVVMISHDRYFLDKTTNRIWELSGKELRDYEGNYTKYRFQKEIEIRNGITEYEKQTRKIDHLNEIINDRKNWFLQAHKAAGQNDFYRAKSQKHVGIMKSKERELEKLEENRLERPKDDMVPYFDIINKTFMNTKLPKFLVAIKNLTKSYGDRVVLENATADILRGEKVGIIGSNGAGKTTLLRIINNLDKEYTGSVSVNPSVKLGYFSQELEGLNYEESILDNVLGEGTNQSEVRLLLAGLLFRENDVFKKVGDLSMGERCRTAFAKLLLSGANTLILDEPTNYMDIPSKEKIEDVLSGFKGSIVFVSHDRYFINRLSSKILEVKDKKINCYYGNYDDYISKKDEEKTSRKVGEDYKELKERITALECQLSFIGGRLNEKLTEEEKQELNDKFIATARELNQCKEKLKVKR